MIATDKGMGRRLSGLAVLTLALLVRGGDAKAGASASIGTGSDSTAASAPPQDSAAAPLASTPLAASPPRAETPAAEPHRPAAVTAGGTVAFERFHTSDLFPGGEALEADWGTRITVHPELTWRLPAHQRVKLWAGVVDERYDIYTDRSVDRWAAGIDLRRGGHRLRLHGGITRHELYFPSTAGGAYLDRALGGAELRLHVVGPWTAEVAAQVERDDYVPTYDERDGRRGTVTTGVLLSGRAGAFALGHVFRRAQSNSHLYSYDQNAISARFESAARGFAGAVLAEIALREYRTGLPYAVNFGREDDRSRAVARLGHALAGPLRLDAELEWRHTGSTRPTKGADVTGFGLVMSAAR